jgi:hypothetical protein
MSMIHQWAVEELFIVLVCVKLLVALNTKFRRDSL